MTPKSTNLVGMLRKTIQRCPGNHLTAQQRPQYIQTNGWSKQYFNKLLPTGNSSPEPRFYGLPKIHRANCPMQPIVPACGTATYQLAKFLTKILQKYTGITQMFVKDSKGFNIWGQYTSENMKSWSPSMYQIFSTSIPVPTALYIINWLFTEHIETPEARVSTIVPLSRMQ